jgi:hypothetical protein
MSTSEGYSVPTARRLAPAPYRADKGLKLDRSTHINALDDCAGLVAAAHAPGARSADIALARAAMDGIAGTLNAIPGVARADHERFLQRLTQIYAQAWDQMDNRAFADTAPAYAAVIEALSRKHPRLDFGKPLGQLLELMTRLFAARDNGWKVVYKHLRAIPDGIGAKQTLTRVCSADIREWFDAGVQNLFSLRKDLNRKIRQLGAHLADIGDEMEELSAKLQRMRRQLDPAGTGKVVGLAARAIERELAALEMERNGIREERAGRRGTLALIESDIREFQGLLREARRAYYLRAV